MLDITTTKPLSSLSSQQIKDVQFALNKALKANLDVDGIFGNDTLYAFNKFKLNNSLGNPGMIGKPSADLLNKYLSTPSHTESVSKDINWSDMSALLTPNFTLGENLRNDPKRIPTDPTVQKNILTIMQELQKIRNDYGKSIIITSGYRPKQVNSAVGGVSNSQHIKGTAVDIRPANGSISDFQIWVDQHWYGALGWGAKKGFVHIDCRNGKGWKTGGEKGVRWNY